MHPNLPPQHNHSSVGTFHADPYPLTPLQILCRRDAVAYAGAVKSVTLATVDLTRNRSLKSSDSQRGFSQAGKESLFIEVWVPPA